MTAWDGLWRDRLQRYGTPQRKHRIALALLQGAAPAFPLVDVGAGPGTFLKLVEEAFPAAAACGIDASGFAAQQRFCASDIIEGSAETWRPPAKVATVACIDVIEHVPSPEPFLAHIASYADRIILICPNFNFYQQRIDVLLGRIPFQNKPQRGGHVYWCQYASLRKLFASCRLSVEAELHEYPKHDWRLARAIGGLRPALFASAFGFRLRTGS